MERKIKLKKNNMKFVIYVVLFVFLFNPHCIDDIWILNYWGVVMKISFFLYCGFIFVKNKKVNQIIIFVVLIFLWTFFMSLIFNNNISNVFIRYSSIILAMMLFDLKKDKIDELLGPSFLAATIIMVANLISIILYPKGIYINYSDWTRVWLIGQKQEFANVFVYFFTIGLYYISKKKKAPWIILLFIAMFYQMVITIPLGLMIDFITLIMLLVFTKVTRIRLKANNLFFITIILNILIVFVAVGNIQLTGLFNILDSIYVTSDITKFTNLLTRFGIWKDAIRVFLSSYGLGMGAFNRIIYDRFAIYSVYHPHFHNMMLDYLATGGLVAVGSYLYIYFLCMKKLNRNKSKLSEILSYSLFAYNILLLTDVYYGPMIMSLYIVSYNIDYLGKGVSENVNKNE